MTLKRRINTHMRVNYQCIPHDKIIDAQFALGNSNCHHNAVAAVRAGRADSVWLVWAGHGNQGAVHFINSRDGRFFDETWHDESNRQDYYIIRKVRPDEYGMTSTWMNAKVVGRDGPACVVAVDGDGYHGSALRSDFRPIRSEEDQFVDEMVPILRDATKQLGSSKAKAAARALYRAIRDGKVPGVKLAGGE